MTWSKPCYFFWSLKTVLSITVSALIAWQKISVGWMLLTYLAKKQAYLSVD